MGKARHILTFALWLGLGGEVFAQPSIVALGYFAIKPHLSSEREIIEEMPLPTEEELMRYTEEGACTEGR